MIGHTVEVQRRDGRVVIRYQGEVVAEHDEASGRHQVRVQPGHGPGAIARNGRRPRGPRTEDQADRWDDVTVEVRDLAVYETLAQGSGGVA